MRVSAEKVGKRVVNVVSTDFFNGNSKCGCSLCGVKSLLHGSLVELFSRFAHSQYCFIQKNFLLEKHADIFVITFKGNADPRDVEDECEASQNYDVVRKEKIYRGSCLYPQLFFVCFPFFLYLICPGLILLSRR